MNEGRLQHFGTYQELVAAGVSFQSLTGAHEQEGASPLSSRGAVYSRRRCDHTHAA